MKLNNNDYIDSRQFTKEECEKFCELAVSQWFWRRDWMSYHKYLTLPLLSIYENGIYWASEARRDWNNVTEQFREYLIGQESISPKSLLKDGMRVFHDCGTIGWVCGHKILFEEISLTYNLLSRYSEDLKDQKAGYFNAWKVIDRDGTIVWERKEQPEPKEMTVAEIEEALGHPIKVVK